MAMEKIEEIRKIAQAGKASVTQDIAADEDVVRMAPNREKFETLLNTEQAKETAAELKVAEADPSKKPSLFDEVRDLHTKAEKARKGSAEDLVAQSTEVISKIDELKTKLATPDLELGKSTRTLMQNRLEHIDDNLRAAMTKMGVEYKPAPKFDPSANPVERYLGLLTQSQHNLQTLASDAAWMGKQNKELNIASMLRIQIKVGFIQQELEFFTSLLNKALESTKTIMNVQV